VAATQGEATFRITIDGNAADATKNVGASARLAAQAITKYEQEIKDLSGDLRRLKGNSDEVNATKKVLKERVDKARAAVSTLTTEISKSGTTFAAAAKSSKKWSDGIVAALGKPLGGARAKLAGKLDGVGKAIGESKVGKALTPAAQAISRFGTRAGATLGKVSGAIKPVTEKALPALRQGLSMAATAGATAAAATAAVAAAAVAGVAAVGALGLAAADSAAKMQRQRQAGHSSHGCGKCRVLWISAQIEHVHQRAFAQRHSVAVHLQGARACAQNRGQRALQSHLRHGGAFLRGHRTRCWPQWR
jgi:hypothetical protein